MKRIMLLIAFFAIGLNVLWALDIPAILTPLFR